MLGSFAQFTMVMLIPVALLCQMEGEIAYETTSEVQTHREYFDRKQSKLKLEESYYEVKRYDKDDKLLSSNRVLNGKRAEFNEQGTCTLVEHYTRGVISDRSEFYESAKLKSFSKYHEGHAGRLVYLREYWDPKDGAGQGKLKLEEDYHANGKLKLHRKYQEEGKPVFAETFHDDGTPESKGEVEYFPDGKVRKNKTTTYRRDVSGVLQASISLMERKEDGSFSVTQDGKKVQEGHFDKAGLKDGEWSYWNPEGKLLKVEKYESGKLKETREYK